MKVLVLFDGDGCVSKSLKKMGHEVMTSDILDLPHIDYPVDILKFDPLSFMMKGFIPDAIWASPPCETWSIMTAVKGGGNMYWETIKNGYNRVIDITPRLDFSTDKRLSNPKRITERRIEHVNYLKRTVSIIQFFHKYNPRLTWIIENPQTGFMKFYIDKLIDGVIHNKTTYCMYGTRYKKATNLFSNIELNLKWCNTPSHHSDSFIRRWDHNQQPKETIIPKSYLERSLVPTDLCIDVFNQLNVLPVLS